jgi:hypothetical protein
VVSGPDEVPAAGGFRHWFIPDCADTDGPPEWFAGDARCQETFGDP